MRDEDSIFLRELARELDAAHRLGADTDHPEGARYIVLSDTIARGIASRLRILRLRGDGATEARRPHKPEDTTGFDSRPRQLFLRVRAALIGLRVGIVAWRCYQRPVPWRNTWL